MAAGKHREIHDIQQSKKMVTFITCKTTFGPHVRELDFGVYIFELNLGIQIDTVKQPIKRNSVGSCIVGLLLLMTFLSLLRCRQRCTTEARLEKNLCLW